MTELEIAKKNDFSHINQCSEKAPEVSIKTILNGNMNENEIAEVKKGEICHLCGKKLPKSNNWKNCDNILEDSCCSCINNEFFVDNDTEATNKRDSGFHTLKRGEKEQVDTGQEAESALSSASSADSALSMGCNTVIGKANNEICEDETLPSIVIDCCDGRQSEDSKLELSESENAFREFDKLNLTGSSDTESPELLARKLFKFDGYKRNDIVKIIGKNTDYSQQVGHAYLECFDFTSSSLIDAYRGFLCSFALIGETQERERILKYFSQRYISCNPDFLDGKLDSVHTLICAITLLNTDLHGNVGFSGRKKMTYKQFSTNLSGLMSNNTDFPKDLLASLYSSVKKQQLPWGGKERGGKVPRSSSMRQNTEPDSRDSPTKIVNRSMSTRSPFKSGKASAIDSSRAGLGRSAKLKPLSHNQGLLWRKALLDCDGKKFPIGKRKWKVYSVALQNLELHIAKRGSTEAKTVSIHHCFAEESTNDSKRQHVFKITFADSSVTLYQASSEKDAKKWIRDINKAAALLSAAPLCSPVGSQLVFRKPLLPSGPSTLPPVNQQSKLQELLKECEDDLFETEKLASENEATSEQTKQYYTDKIAYLRHEIKKYKHYIKTLQIILRMSSSLSDEYKSNLENSDNGSVVSVTPSEPPLASPSPITSTENFMFSAAPDEAKSEPGVFFCSPAHLVSPQHRNVALTPTSSLPNLSPIMESPTRALVSNNSSLGSLRRRKRKEMYESSLNGEDNGDVNLDSMNSNNSNHLLASHQSTPLKNSMNASGSESKHMGEYVQSPRKEFLPNDVDSTPKNLFPVKRFQMRIAEMDRADFSKNQSRNTVTAKCNSNLHHVPLRQHFNHQPENLMLTRVKGRREKKGIERYSYMQAISPFEES